MDCICTKKFELAKEWKLTMKGMKVLKSNGFKSEPFNIWKCTSCGKEHIKDW